MDTEEERFREQVLADLASLKRALSGDPEDPSKPGLCARLATLEAAEARRESTWRIVRSLLIAEVFGLLGVLLSLAWKAAHP